MPAAISEVVSVAKRFKDKKLSKRVDKLIARLQKRDEDRIARRRENFRLQREIKAALAEAKERRAILADAEKAGHLVRQESGGWDEAGQPITKLKADPVLEQTNTQISLYEERLASLDLDRDPPQLSAVFLKKQIDAIPFDATITDAPVEISLGEGESLEEALYKLRVRIGDKIEERDMMAQRPRTRDEQLIEAVAQVRAMKLRGLPKVLPLQHGGKIDWPKTKLPLGKGHSYHFATDGVALIALLFEEQLISKLTELIDGNSDHSHGIKASEQKAAVAAIDAELVQLHREEAALVEAVVAKGGDAYHLADAPLEAVLQIKIGRAPDA